MRILYISCLLNFFFIYFTTAQTMLFDPSTLGNNLPSGMKVVDIGYKKYLQIIVNGMNSTLDIPEVKVIPGTRIIGDIGFGQLSNASLKYATISFLDTANLVPTNWDPSLFVPAFSNFFENPAKDGFIKLKTNIHNGAHAFNQVNVNYQNTENWNPTVGDSIWLGIVQTMESKQNDSIIFDPNTYLETLPFGMQITEIDSRKLLKITLDARDKKLDLDYVYKTIGFNTLIFEAFYSKGTSGVNTINTNIVISLLDAEQHDQSIQITPAPDTIANFNENIGKIESITSIQFNAQDILHNLNSVTGSTIYIGKISMKYVEPPHAEPPSRARVLFTNQKISIDGEADDAYLLTKEYYVNKDANGRVNGEYSHDTTKVIIAENQNSYATWHALWDNDNYYLYANILDNDPINLNGSVTPWLNDGIEIFIDIQDRRYIEGYRIDQEQHQIRINFDTINSVLNGVLSGPEFIQGEGNDTTNITYFVKPTNDGYNFEMAIPWTTFFKTAENTRREAYSLAKDSINLINNKKIAFELSLIDATRQNGRRSMLNWSNTTGIDVSYLTNEFYGQLNLAMDTVEHLKKATKPDGKSKACFNNIDEYTTKNIKQGTFYNWKLIPEDAGVLTPIDSMALIAWENPFIASASLIVNAFSIYEIGVYSDTLFIQVNPLPQIWLGNDTTIINIDTLEINAGEGYSLYSWNTGDSSNSILVLGQEIDLGSHNFSVTITDLNSCSNKDSISVTIIPMTGLDDTEQVITVYPNPTGNFVRIESNIEISSIELFDINGFIIFKSDKIKQGTILNLDQYSSGIYLIKITNIVGSVRILKVLKK